METRAALLTERFYAFELTGRGYVEYPYPVELEPAFTPFPGHFLPRGLIKDDGRHPSVWEQLTQGGFLPGFFGGAKPKAPEVEVEPAPPAPTAWRAPPQEELHVSLPPSSRDLQRRAASFLQTLPRGIDPLTFELRAAAGRGEVVFAVSRPVAALVQEQLGAFFPESSIFTGPTLNKLWGEATATAILEFGLGHECMLPLASPQTVEPLTAFQGLARSTGADEGLCLQLIFTPARAPWAESIMRAVTAPDGSPFFSDAPEITAGAVEKLSSPLYAATLRLTARAKTHERAWGLVLALSGLLRQFEGRGCNAFVPLATESPEQLQADFLKRSTHRSGMLLSLTELVGLVHPLSMQTTERTAPAPAAAKESGIPIGENHHHGTTTPVRLSTPARLRHTHVLGASGTGKSVFLVNLVLADAAAGNGIVVLDPHGDLIDDILPRLPTNRVDDVIYLDPVQEQHIVGWNILEAHSAVEKELLASDLVGVFRRLSTSWGDQMTAVLSSAVLAFLESSRGGTLLDLREFLVDPKFRTSFLETIEDEHLVSWWKTEFPMLTGSRKPQGPILTRLGSFLRNSLVREVVTERPGINFRRLLDDRRILLAKLSQGAIGQENAALLGTLLVSKIHQTALSRQDTAKTERRPVFIYMDEFHEMATASMATLFSGIRKYGLGLVIAHQDLFQLHATMPTLERAVLANAHTRICFRLGDEDTRTMAKGFAHFEAEDLGSLGIGEAIVRLGRRQDDFNLATANISKLSPEEARHRREQLIARAGENFGRLREVPAFEANREQETEEEQAAPIVLPPSSLPERAAAAEASTKQPGRGGAQHIYLQEIVRRWGEERGFKATIEYQLEGGGWVDVLLERGEETIACEISSTTSVAQEIANVEKCFRAGIREVAVISLRPKLLKQLSAQLKKKLGGREDGKVECYSPEEFMAYLGSEKPTQTIGGYAVTVNVSEPAGLHTSARSKAITDIMLGRLKKLKDTQE